MSVQGRNESLFTQIFPSLPMLRTWRRILSACPIIITDVRSSSPGWESRTIPAFPLNWWMAQDLGFISSKNGFSTPYDMAASSPIGLGAAIISFIHWNCFSGMDFSHTGLVFLVAIMII